MANFWRKYKSTKSVRILICWLLMNKRVQPIRAIFKTKRHNNASIFFLYIMYLLNLYLSNSTLSRVSTSYCSSNISGWKLHTDGNNTRRKPWDLTRSIFARGPIASIPVHVPEGVRGNGIRVHAIAAALIIALPLLAVDAAICSHCFRDCSRRRAGRGNPNASPYRACINAWHADRSQVGTPT